MKIWLLNPLFLFGLATRIALLIFIPAAPINDWYIPFFEFSIENLSIDPWASWLNSLGDYRAFPYGYAMWLFFLPWIILAKFIFIPISYGYGAAIIFADLILLLTLDKLFSNKRNKLIAIYWLSPIILIAIYVLGYNDLIPICFLILSIYLIKINQFIFSGVFLVAAISAKLSMFLTLPFFLIYFLHNRSIFQKFSQFLFGFILAFISILLPFLFSIAGIQMVLTNPEVTKIYQLSIPVLKDNELYLFPLLYLLLLYLAWQIKRVNFELFYNFLGIVFLVFVLLIPASPGWFVWVVPLLISYQLSNDRFAMSISNIFIILYIICISFFLSSYDVGLIHHLLASNNFNISLGTYNHLSSFAYTALVSISIILIIRIWKNNIVRNDFFRLSRKPFVIGIAGDSGSGKDTFANIITDLFGKHSTTHLSGDDYHLWDRKQPMWNMLTHINPSANDLESFTNDLVSLIDGKTIRIRHYDHSTGLSGEPINLPSKDLIISSGLHALYLPLLRSCYDLSIYLDINEELRCYLKVLRDIKERGYSADHVMKKLEERRVDSSRFIHPQAHFADLIFSVQPAKISELDEQVDPNLLHLKLIIRSRQGLNELSLKRILVAICGLHVEIELNPINSEVILIIDGDCQADDIAMAAKILCPNIFDFFDFEPKWYGGVLGLMQITTISFMQQALTKRFI
ncbi:uridine kinase [Polynucleobacter sp. MWH-UH24A]|uniref:uridine kinase n=1 Tax=Polynucleobacter sp. MWH-UH24A TaxID=2689110 RepID=UPI001BFCDDFD|nr:uridine kinase [Polynucleobacter sp. MWH-UH24A]QWD76371.1 uridine kinase [Polynucleobacter sp. MWH-UH24A]